MVEVSPTYEAPKTAQEAMGPGGHEGIVAGPTSYCVLFRVVRDVEPTSPVQYAAPTSTGWPRVAQEGLIVRPLVLIGLRIPGKNLFSRAGSRTRA